jgi:hypothetical protein
MIIEHNPDDLVDEIDKEALSLCWDRNITIDEA